MRLARHPLELSELMDQKGSAIVSGCFISTAMMPEMVAAGVPPGMAIMSRPVEPLVMASSFSRGSAPERVAAPILEPSETGR